MKSLSMTRRAAARRCAAHGSAAALALSAIASVQVQRRTVKRYIVAAISSHGKLRNAKQALPKRVCHARENRARLHSLRQSSTPEKALFRRVRIRDRASE